MRFKAWLHSTVGFSPWRWIHANRHMRDMARSFDAGGQERERPSCLVVVSPWLGTWVPLFTIGVGLMLAKRGCRVTFALDDYRFGPNPIRHAIVSRVLRRLIGDLRARFDIIDLRALPPAPRDDGDERAIARLAKLNATWALRGEIVQRGRAAIETENAARIRTAFGPIAAVFEHYSFDFLFTPGGVFGTSGIWAEQARKAGLRVSTFDTGGYETIMVAVDGLACQLGDVPAAFRRIRDELEHAPERRAEVLAAAQDEIAKRREGADAFESQIRDAGAGGSNLDGGILVALNSSWDAAALGLHDVYAGNTQWIVGTVRHLLDSTDRPVIVRQHPAERLPFAATSDDYGALLNENFGSHPRLHFIAANELVNTYALLERMSAVVVHSSTIGIEAASFGLPVITGSNAYYSSLGFVFKAGDLRAYHGLLEAAGSGRLTVSPAMRDDAQLCFYITQLCNWVFSQFNPADYPVWSRKTFDHWYAEPGIKRMIDAIVAGTPVAVLNHAARSPRIAG